MREEISLPREELNLLLAEKNGDCALLYLWLRSGREMPLPMEREKAKTVLSRLTKLGLYEPPHKAMPPAERPVYSEAAVSRMLQQKEFAALLGETQRRLGRVLSTEEVKCLLSVYDYLRLPGEVIGVLVTYCVQRNQARGVRAPSLRSIEKEAYAWADLGVDTLETAVEHMRAQMARLSRVGRICGLMQLGSRKLTAAEERYVHQWLSWGFPDEAITMAYEKTCINTGGLKWPYMNSILASWHEQGLHTAEQIRTGDGGGKKTAPAKKGNNKLEKGALLDFLEEG